jgi:hypothetical protein
MSLSPAHRGRRSPAVLIALAASLIAMLCVACGSSDRVTAAATTTTATSTATTSDPLTVVTRTGPTARTPPGARASVQVGAEAAVPATSTRQSFLGIATEISTITSLSGPPTDPDTAFISLLRNLSPGAPVLLRLGGDSTDWSWWKVPGMKQPPGIRYTITPAWAADVKALLTALGAKALLGVNLELDSRRVAAYEVSQYEKDVGPKLIDGLELGNEPELYAAFNYYRTKQGVGVTGRALGHYTLADYARDFTNIASALGNIPLVGPSSGSAAWLPELGTLLSDLPARLKLITVHAYPLLHCSPSSHLTDADFFAPASLQGLAEQIHGMVRAAAAHGKALRLDETNGITCGGQSGVSNSFGEALWALNFLPALWQAGVQGVNVQTIDGNNNDMISASHTSAGWSVSVQPEYYGLLTFADAVPAGSHLLKITAPASPELYQFAARATDGSERVVLTNIGSSLRTLGVRVRGAHGTGSVAVLTAASLTATSGTSLAGQKLSPRTGSLTGPAHSTQVEPNVKGVYAVKVPAHAAAILTVSS